jgi:8-oxo-dGTP diphosphatase
MLEMHSIHCYMASRRLSDISLDGFSPMKRSGFRFVILAVDVAVIAVIKGAPHVLLMAVHLPPDIVHAQALPGGLLQPDETAEDAVMRILADKCRLSGFYSEQLGAFSAVDRDPRGRVVSVAYLVLLPAPAALALELPHGLRWCEIAKVGAVAYDHDEIIAAALERLRTKLQSTTIARHLLAPQFTLSQLQGTYESVLGRTLDKRNFRKKLIAGRIVRPTGKKLRSVLGRPGELYRFAGDKVELVSILSGL